jgi:hypothetical protein
MQKVFEEHKKTGRLTINDSEEFIKILTLESDDSTEVESMEHYDAMKKYGIKQLHNIATDIPFNEYEFIINFAIAKTIKDFNPEFNTNLLSFFWDKLRGELSAYRSKRDRLQDKVNKLIKNNDGIDYIYQKEKGSDDNYIIPVEETTMEEQHIQEDLYFRQMKALKMAFSGIPRELQLILHEVGNGKKIREIANILNQSTFDISRKRNQGLSLILQRVMRSKHLTEEEKQEIANLHEIHLEENIEFEESL